MRSKYKITELDACYPCPDVDCDGVVEYETTGYWQCSECSFRAKAPRAGLPGATTTTTKKWYKERSLTTAST